MAEARSIAALGEEFSAGNRVGLFYDDEGVHIKFNLNVPPPREALRRFLRWTRSVYRAMHYSFFPFGPLTIGTFAVLLSAVVVASDSKSWIRSGPVAQLVWDVSNKFPWLAGTSLGVKVAIMAAWTAVFALLLLALIRRWLLKALLTDKSYVYQARSPGIWVKVWSVLVKVLTSGHPLTYSYQSALPRLPVPELKETVDRYKSYARVLQNDEEYKKTEELAASFLANEGPKIQWYLKLKSWFYPNYVTDWWEKYVYLYGRDPIAINSNYYVFDGGRYAPTKIQEARAGVVVHAVCTYMQQLTNETIPPVMGGPVPLCMWQFERMFCTSRLPGRECDEVKHWDPATIRHIAVYCKGSFYKVEIFRRDGSIRSPDQLEAIFGEIKADAAERVAKGQLDETEACIPALTGWNRTEWAQVRETYFSEGQNRRSMHAVESALFYMVLSDKVFADKDEGWSPRARYLIGADKSYPDIWFDKSVNLIFTADGRVGLNCEHSWADAPVAGHLFEASILVADALKNPYKPDGHVDPTRFPSNDPGCSATRERSNSFGRNDVWNRLTWSLDRKVEVPIAAAKACVNNLSDDLDLHVRAFSDYGKDFIKKCKVSPDAYVQMAMQLAYHRDQGHLDNTYESSMTRLFLQGRTETVRPLTMEARQFVETMNNPKANPLDKLKALQRAAGRHERGNKDANCGKGIDRHLFALYVVSRGKNIESEFLKRALDVKWRLSTSQQPQQQTNLWDLRLPENQAKMSPGGGFGPVAADGYGVSYMVAGEREFFFHVSSKTSAPNTDSKRFQDGIFQALRDMKAIMTTGLEGQAKEAEEKKAAIAAAK